MRINVSIDISILNEVIDEINKNNISEIDLIHVPFKEFKLISKNHTDYNTILDTVKEEQLSKLGKVDIFSCTQQASRLYASFKNINFYTAYKITETELFIKCSGDDVHTNKINNQFEVTIPHDGKLNMVNSTIKNDVNLISKQLIEEIQSLKTSEERRKYMSSLIVDELAALLAVFTIFQRKATYEFNESENTVIKNKKKSNNKNRNKVTYIRHKDINIVKRVLTNNSSNAYERHTESWVSRGHWRTYKSGKKVWIKEQVKKAKNSIDNKDVTKTYEII